MAKEHSAEYQSQALIDLARSLNKKVGNISNIESPLKYILAIILIM